MTTYNQKYYEANKEKIKKASRSYYKAHRAQKKAYSRKYAEEHQAEIRSYMQSTKTKWRTYQREAQKRGLEWELTFEEFETLFNQVCYYHGGPGPSRGIDRRNNKKGYTRANSAPCCFMCNLMKRGWSHKEFLKRVRKIAARFPPPSLGYQRRPRGG